MLTRKQSWRRVKPPKARFHESSDCTETDGYSKRVYSQLNNKNYIAHNLEPREVVHRVPRTVTVPEQVVMKSILSAAGIFSFFSYFAPQQYRLICAHRCLLLSVIIVITMFIIVPFIQTYL